MKLKEYLKISINILKNKPNSLKANRESINQYLSRKNKKKIRKKNQMLLGQAHEPTSHQIA